MTARELILNRLQRDLPLVREPYELLAAEVACREADVLAAIESARAEGLIREIAGVFEAAAVGYRRALVAMRVPAAELDRAGQIAAGHPGVSHCYARSDAVNLWLTLAVSPRSRLGLERTAEVLAREAHAQWHGLLPTVRRYKLQVRFDAATGELDAEGGEAEERQQAAGGRQQEEEATLGATAANSAAAAPKHESGVRSSSPTEEQVRAIRALQIDLPARRDPFAAIAAAESLDPDVLLIHGADFLAAGWMRRYAAMLRHAAAGAKANLLVAWQVADADADAAGRAAAQSPAVSHCYLRPALPDWPYNLYTMIHGRSREECEMAADAIFALTGLARRSDLWTQREYKKRAVRLYSGEEEKWEATRR
jgi:DNA-binding Lrp family transcriptional regulator